MQRGEKHNGRKKKRFLLPGIDNMLRGYNGKTPIYFVHKNKNEEDILFIFEPHCSLLFLRGLYHYLCNDKLFKHVACYGFLLMLF